MRAAIKIRLIVSGCSNKYFENKAAPDASAKITTEQASEKYKPYFLPFSTEIFAAFILSNPGGKVAAAAAKKVRTKR